MEPAQRLMEFDLQSPEYISGAWEGLWGQTPHSRVEWPRQLFWIAVPPRAGAPDKYFVLLDTTGYRAASPTGTFVDPQTLAQLDNPRRPKGRENSRFAKVFRTDWEEGRAFYHPYDRVATATHDQWTTTMPRKIWTSRHTIVDYLEEFHAMFQSEDYLGV